MTDFGSLGRLLILPLILAAGSLSGPSPSAGPLLETNVSIEADEDPGAAEGDDQPRSGVRRIGGRVIRSCGSAVAARSIGPTLHLAEVTLARRPGSPGGSAEQTGFDFPPPARGPPEA